MKRPVIIILAGFLLLLLTSWGYIGHQKISGGVPFLLPGEMIFLTPEWTDIVRLHASDADYRKDTDPDEAPRHYIDIDNYPEFVSSGAINHNLDSMIAKYGSGYVYDQGILPWATRRAFDSVVSCFERKDWNKAGLFAADLGHYVGDGHMPLHLTRNYDGQYTSQNGVHSRFESKMINRFADQIILLHEPVDFVDDVTEYIFAYIYSNYRCVDSVLLADVYADSIAGNTWSEIYYQSMWNYSKGFTIRLFQDASHSLTELIYTAWVMAGKPILYPNAIPEVGTYSSIAHFNCFPNPVYSVTTLSWEVREPNHHVTLEVYDLSGTRLEILLEEKMHSGYHEIRWDASGIEAGIYFSVLKTGDAVLRKKMIVFN